MSKKTVENLAGNPAVFYLMGGLFLAGGLIYLAGTAKKAISDAGGSIGDAASGAVDAVTGAPASAVSAVAESTKGFATAGINAIAGGAISAVNLIAGLFSSEVRIPKDPQLALAGVVLKYPDGAGPPTFWVANTTETGILTTARALDTLGYVFEIGGNGRFTKLQKKGV